MTARTFVRNSNRAKSADEITDGQTKVPMLLTERSKLAGITGDGSGGGGVTTFNPIPKSFAGKVGNNQTYTLDAAPATAANVIVFVGGTRQVPVADYTISGTTLTILINPTGLEVDTIILSGGYAITTLQGKVASDFASAIGLTTVESGLLNKANIAGGNDFTGTQTVNGGPLWGGGIPPNVSTRFPSNDLDDVKVGGVYRIVGSTNAPSTSGNGFLLVWNRAADRIHQIAMGDGGLSRRFFNGTVWTAWIVGFDETTLSAPVVVARNRLIDRNDIRDYETGIDLFSTTGNALDKFKAAASAFTDDGSALSVLRVPRGRIRFGDTWLINKIGFKMRGAGRQHWGRPYGETTGGSNHPLTGTQFETVGAGVARRWSDVNNGGAGDETKKPVIALGMPGIEMTDFSIVTPRTGTAANIWDNGIRLLGVDGCKLKRFNCYGGFNEAGIMLDATHSKNNNAMNTMIDGYGLAPTRDSNLMSYGITDNLFEDFEASGVSAIKLKGTDRGKGSAGQYDATTWLWSPNGCSDTKFKNFRLYQFGDNTIRKASGALIYLDYRLFTGATPNNSAQNIAFENGRLDGAGKWAIYLGNIDVVWFRQLFGESSAAWFTSQAQRSVIERVAACGPDRYFSQCKMFFNAVSNGSAEATITDNYWDGRGVIV